MANIEINQFPGSTVVDATIFHGKNVANQDISVSGLAVKQFVLAAIPVIPEYHELSARSPINAGDYLRVEKNTQDGYASITINALKNYIGNIFFPVGNIYLTYTNTNPSTLLGFGTWVQEARGRVLLGEGTGVDVNGVSRTFGQGITGGVYTVALTPEQMPPHRHKLFGDSTYYGTSTILPTGQQTVASTFGNYTVNESYRMSPVTSNMEPTAGHTSRVGGPSNSTTGTDGAPHTNIQPYTVVYVWRRTA